MSLTQQRLTRLVKHRERLERLEEKHLADQLRLQMERERALAATRDERSRLFDQQAPDRGGVDLEGLSAAAAYIRRLEREIVARESALAHSAVLVAEARGRLLERRRDRRALETLLEQRIAEERLQQRRDDIKRIDEVAGRGWSTRQDGHAAGRK